MRILVRSFLILALGSGLFYAGDYVAVRYRIPGNREQLGTVKVRRYYAVPQKDGKVQFLFDDPEMDTCSHSVFPQLGYTPCWYLNKHNQKRIDM